MEQAFNNIVQKSLKSTIDSSVDFIGNDGLWHCGHCGKPKQKYIHCLGKEWLVGFICECQENAGKEKRELEARNKVIQERLNECFENRTAHTAKDDAPDTDAAKVCDKYAQSFEKAGKWLVLYGGVGTGKSYRAAKACRDVINRGKRAKFTTLAEIERSLWDNDKAEVYKKLDSYDLIVLDDFGAERQSDYTKEIRYNVVDMRYNSNKAMIITTNVKKFDSDDLADKRVFSRISEKALYVKMDGADRRKTNILTKADIDRLLTEDGWEDL